MDLDGDMKKKVIIIGGGPAGYNAAISCSRAGMETILFEQDRLGGTCVNRGCVPTKVYLEAVKAKQHLQTIGIKTDLDPAVLRRAAESKITQLGFGAEYVLRKNSVEIRRTSASIAGEKLVKTAEGELLSCDALVLASGSAPVVPKGLDCANLYTVPQLLELSHLPKTLTIVGAGILGLELAVILSAVGVKITLLEREAEILPGWDQDVRSSMHGYLKRIGIEIKLGAEETKCENAVYCTGHRPSLPEGTASGIDLKKSDWIYIIGDAAGKYMVADTAMEEGSRIAEQILRGRKYAELKPAKCIFTPLQAASVGEVCRSPLRESYFSVDDHAAGKISGIEGGFVKAVMEEGSHVLKGFHIVSTQAAEIIQIGQVAIAEEMRAEEFIKLVFPHPTEGEILKEAVKLLCG